jgi:cell division protein FtsQ
VGARSKRNATKYLSKQKIKIRRARSRRPFPERVKRFFVITAKLCLACCILAASVLLGITIHNFLFKSSYFHLKNLVIQGVSPELARDLQAASGLNTDPSPNLLTINAEQIRRRVASHPKIKYVRVVKQYPSSLIIRALEREPVAIVNSQEMYLIDADGVAIERLDPKNKTKVAFPFITGVPASRIQLGQPIDLDALLRSIDLIVNLQTKNEDLYQQLAEVNISEKNEITAYLKGGVEIRFGTTPPVEKLPALEAFATRMRTLKNLHYADFRFGDQIYYVMR